MLSELYIRNYLFVREMRLGLGQGLTVISGETGAGKSILVGSISLIFGDKGVDLEPFDKDKPIYLEATFDISDNQELKSFLASQGYEEMDELILARDCNVSGKSQYFLAGRKVAYSLIKELKNHIIDFHHQRDQQKLLVPAYQLEVLDSFAGILEDRESFASLYRELKSGLGRLNQLKRQQEADLQLRELYQYQFEELDKAQLQPDEDKYLQQEFELLSHSQEIGEIAESALAELTEADLNIYDRLRSILSGLSKFSHLDDHLNRAGEAITEAQSFITEASSLLKESSSTISIDPQRLSKIQDRLDLINSLIYKHKVTCIKEVMELFVQRQTQLEAMEDNSRLISGLEIQLQKDYEVLIQKAEELSKRRHLAAAVLADEMAKQIQELAIPKAIVEIRIDKKQVLENSIQAGLSALDETGLDSARIMFSANPGAEIKPLAAVASGGELSRVLLAIKKVLSEKLPPKLVILDEIDSGIGGKAAEHVADFISQLSRQHQVLCISHLAQIAVASDSHFAIQKQSETGKTTVEIMRLESENRLREIARMLSGSITELSVMHAKELIDKRGNK